MCSRSRYEGIAKTFLICIISLIDLTYQFEFFLSPPLGMVKIPEMTTRHPCLRDLKPMGLSGLYTTLSEGRSMGP